MLFVGTLKVIGVKCQMEFTFAQIVRLGMVFQPSQLQLEITHIVAQIRNDEIIGGYPSHFMQIESFLVELNGTV